MAQGRLVWCRVTRLVATDTAAGRAERSTRSSERDVSSRLQCAKETSRFVLQLETQYLPDFQIGQSTVVSVTDACV